MPIDQIPFKVEIVWIDRRTKRQKETEPRDLYRLGRNVIFIFVVARFSDPDHVGSNCLSRVGSLPSFILYLFTIVLI